MYSTIPSHTQTKHIDIANARKRVALIMKHTNRHSNSELYTNYSVERIGPSARCGDQVSSLQKRRSRKQKAWVSIPSQNATILPFLQK